MTFESFRGLLYEIRDLSKGAAIYAADISGDSIDGPFNLAMYNVIAEKADAVLGLFDVIEFLPEIEAVKRKIELQYGAAGNA